MSRGVEKLIRRMVAPNADVRCFATEALDDSYWVPKEALKAVHKAAHRMGVCFRLNTRFPDHITRAHRQVGESFTGRFFGNEHRR